VNVVFTLSLFGGTAVLAVWVAMRFPQLAPKSLLRRVIGAGVSVAVLQVAPIVSSGAAVLYLTVFALAVILLAVWLHALWMIQGVRDLNT
jgi:hypothetical protein